MRQRCESFILRHRCESFILNFCCGLQVEETNKQKKGGGGVLITCFSSRSQPGRLYQSERSRKEVEMPSRTAKIPHPFSFMYSRTLSGPVPKLVHVQRHLFPPPPPPTPKLVNLPVHFDFLFRLNTHAYLSTHLLVYAPTIVPT